MQTGDVKSRKWSGHVKVGISTIIPFSMTLASSMALQCRWVSGKVLDFICHNHSP